MLADPKARRLATEFFGQWLGFYHFDQYKGVDTSRFPEFTDEVKAAMYDEAVSFFEHIIRKDRPVREMLYADYTFLNKPLAKYYGVKKEIKSTDEVELVEGANALPSRRLAALGRGADGDVRAAAHQPGEARRLGFAARAGDSGAAAAGGCRIDSGRRQAVRRPVAEGQAGTAQAQCRPAPIATCASIRSVFRWSTTIRPAAGASSTADGKPIEDSAALADKTEIDGVDGLAQIPARRRTTQVRRTLANQADRLRAGPHGAGFRSTADRSHGGGRRRRDVFAIGDGDRQPAGSSAIGWDEEDGAGGDQDRARVRSG